MTPVPESLLREARCADADPGMFFAPKGDNFMVQRAKALCADCPVRQPCGEWALHNLADDAEDTGVWGGMSPSERKRERRRRGLRRPGGPAPEKPCGTEAAHRRHVRRGEKPCAACVAGHRRYNAERVTGEKRRRKAEKDKGRQRRAIA